MRSPTSRLLSSRLAIISLIVAAFLGLCALLPVGAQNYAWADGEDPIAIWSDLNNDASTSDEGTVELALSYHPEIGQWLAVITNLSDNPLPASALYVLENNSNSWMTASFDGVSSFESLEGTINESDSTSSFEHASAQLYRTPINLSDATVALAAGEEPVDTADVKVAMIVGDRKESAAGRLATWNNIAQTGEGTYADTTEDGIGLFIGSDGITITNSSDRDLPTSQFMLTMAASGIVYTYDLDAIPAGGSASLGLELTDFDFIDAMLVEAAPAGSVTVTFNMMHYGSQVAPITVAKGETITLPDPSSFAELGYVFQGWTIDAEKTVAFDPSQPIEEDMTLYASWDQDPAYFPPSGDALGFWQANTNDEDGFLFWQPDGSRVGTTADGIELRIDSNTATITNNSASDLPPTTLLLWTPKTWWVPNDKGSGIIFLNFDALPVGSNASGSFTMPGTDWVMRAHLYGAPSVTVTFDMNGHGTQVDPITVAKGGTITLPAPDSFAEQGWDFGGWTVDAQNTLDFDPSQTIEKDTTLYARWTEVVKYATVTFESALGTAPDPVTVERGGTVELPVLAGDEDNVFAGWVVKGSEVADPFKGEYVAEGDATLVAVWVASEPGTPDGPADNPSDKPGDGGNGNGSGATKPSGSNGSASQGAGAPAIPKTGDDQGAPLAPLFLGGVALAAAGVAFCAYRRRPAR